MCGWRNPHARSPPLTVIVKIRLDALVARRLPSCLEGNRPHIREEHLFVSAREISTACFNGSHLTALISSIGSRIGPPMTRICQNCTILIRPSTAYNIDPRKPWTETWCPVSSNTSRLAAASACSPGLSLPFGSTQDLYLRNRTTAMRGLVPFSKTIPPAARIGGGSFASARRFMALPSIVSAAHAGSAYLTRG